MNIKEILKSLSDSVGVAGEENSASQLALSYLKNYDSNAYIDDMFNVVGSIKSDKKKPTVLLDAHIDEIGFIVSYITDDGFIKVGNCGGIDRRLLFAQQVTIHGKEQINGVFISTPPHLNEGDKKVPQLSDIYIDTGYKKDELLKIVSLGNRVTISSKCIDLLGTKICGKALDDRAGVASILYALELIKGKELGCNVSILFSSQEEVGERGAKVSAFSIEPDIALVVDVSFALTCDDEESKCGKMGEGAMIGFSPSLDKKLSNEILSIAKEKEIPYQIEVMSGTTGTNADEIGSTKGGVKAVTISIPLKYMHTPVEVVDIIDVENTGKLIAEYLLSF